MEKIACVLWKPSGVQDDVFAKGVRAAAPELAGLGAMNLRVNTVDEHVAAGSAVRVGRMDPPKAAFVTFWLHEADALQVSRRAHESEGPEASAPRAASPCGVGRISTCRRTAPTIQPQFIARCSPARTSR